MSAELGERDGASRPESAAPLHPKSFKLRFASRRELGRSYVSAVKPLRLPAVVRAEFYRREPEGEVDELLAESALARVRDMFGRGPREKYPAPLTSSHEYGWWRARGGAPGHRLRDSAWLKERVRALADDAGYRRR